MFPNETEGFYFQNTSTVNLCFLFHGYQHELIQTLFGIVYVFGKACHNHAFKEQAAIELQSSHIPIKDRTLLVCAGTTVTHWDANVEGHKFNPHPFQ